MPFLSERLVAVMELLPRSETIADIGADHGKLSVAMVQAGICSKVIATDVSRGSYEKLVNMAQASDMERTMECRLGDGLSVLSPGEVQTTVIAGMGGRLIADILENDRELAQSMVLVLLPMQQTADLRKYLRTHDFYIDEESMVQENGKFYAAMRVCGGQENSWVHARVYDEVGPKLFERRDMVSLRCLRHKLYSLQKTRQEVGAQEELDKQIELLEAINDAWGDE